MRHCTVLILVVLFVGVFARPSPGDDLQIAGGDYDVRITRDGLEVKHKGVRFICGSRFNISKPGWRGTIYTAHDLLASKSAKIERRDDAIAITDSIPEIGGRIVREIRLDESGLLISATLQVTKEISASPVEYTPAIFPADVFAGGRCRATGLLGTRDWQPLPTEKPKATGPGTHLMLNNVFGVELENSGVTVSIENLKGPAPSFYDMRSREYPPYQRNYWLLYQFRASKGGISVTTRISAKATESQKTESASGEVVILDGESRHEGRAIVVGQNAHEIEKAAAKELQQYISKICGRKLPIIESKIERPFERGVIYVGKCEAARGAGFQPGEFAEDEYDGFVVRSESGNVFAAGENHLGTTYAVYRLLEKLGCRFYANELERVPAKSVLEIPGPFTMRDSAAFEWRAMLGTIAPMKCGLSPGEWPASVAGVDVPKMMGIPKGGFWHHTMGFLLPAKDLVDSHPEYLARIRGERKVVRAAVQQYCLSNPGLLRRMTDAVLKWIAEDPYKLYYPVHYGDVARFCECDKCQALYKEKGSVTDAVIWFDNQIAKEVAEKFPGKFITILAYHSTRKPPAKVRPEPNLLIVFCAIVECQGRPWSAPINMKRNVCKDLEDWIAIHPLGPKGIITFDYPTTYHYAGFPYPALYAYVENVRYYGRLGLRGVYVCGLGGWKHLEHLYSYVMPRIMWDPERDLGALIDEFTQAWYGGAWKPMRDYVEMLHRGAMESKSEGVMDCHAGPGQRFFRELYTREFLDKALALFEDAEELAENDFVRRRIMKEKWGLLFVDLFLHGQSGGDLRPAATELGVERATASREDYEKMAEFLRINRLFNRPWDMAPRRNFTLSSIVGFEPTTEQWWECPKIKELMEHPAAAYEKQSGLGQELGRYLVTLESRRLKAVLIPRLGGRVWRLYDKAKKHDLLWRGAVPISALERGLTSARYVNLGGYEEYTGREFGSAGWAETYETKLADDGRSATLTTSLPNGLRLTRSVSLAEDAAAIEIDSVLENSSDKVVERVMLRAHPQFAFAPGEKEIELSVKTRGDDFQAVEVKSGENFFSEDKLPAGAWRVTFPSGGLRITHEFDSKQVSACLLYVGVEFFNLELFSREKDLAPGERIHIRHRYLIGGQR